MTRGHFTEQQEAESRTYWRGWRWGWICGWLSMAALVAIAMVGR